MIIFLYKTTNIIKPSVDLSMEISKNNYKNISFLSTLFNIIIHNKVCIMISILICKKGILDLCLLCIMFGFLGLIFHLIGYFIVTVQFKHSNLLDILDKELGFDCNKFNIKSLQEILFEELDSWITSFTKKCSNDFSLMLFLCNNPIILEELIGSNISMSKLNSIQLTPQSKNNLMLFIQSFNDGINDPLFKKTNTILKSQVLSSMDLNTNKYDKNDILWFFQSNIKNIYEFLVEFVDKKKLNKAFKEDILLNINFDFNQAKTKDITRKIEKFFLGSSQFLKITNNKPLEEKCKVLITNIKDSLAKIEDHEFAKIIHTFLISLLNESGLFFDPITTNLLYQKIQLKLNFLNFFSKMIKIYCENEVFDETIFQKLKSAMEKKIQDNPDDLNLLILYEFLGNINVSSMISKAEYYNNVLQESLQIVTLLKNNIENIEFSDKNVKIIQNNKDFIYLKLYDSMNTNINFNKKTPNDYIASIPDTITLIIQKTSNLNNDIKKELLQQTNYISNIDSKKIIDCLQKQLAQENHEFNEENLKIFYMQQISHILYNIAHLCSLTLNMYDIDISLNKQTDIYNIGHFYPQIFSFSKLAKLVQINPIDILEKYTNNTKLLDNETMSNILLIPNNQYNYYTIMNKHENKMLFYFFIKNNYNSYYNNNIEFTFSQDQLQGNSTTIGIKHLYRTKLLLNYLNEKNAQYKNFSLTNVTLIYENNTWKIKSQYEEKITTNAGQIDKIHNLENSLDTANTDDQKLIKTILLCSEGFNSILCKLYFKYASEDINILFDNHKLEIMDSLLVLDSKKQNQIKCIFKNNQEGLNSFYRDYFVYSSSIVSIFNDNYNSPILFDFFNKSLNYISKWNLYAQYYYNTKLKKTSTNIVKHDISIINLKLFIIVGIIISIMCILSFVYSSFITIMTNKISTFGYVEVLNTLLQLNIGYYNALGSDKIIINCVEYINCLEKIYENLFKLPCKIIGLLFVPYFISQIICSFINYNNNYDSTIEIDTIENHNKFSEIYNPAVIIMVCIQILLIAIIFIKQILTTHRDYNLILEAKNKQQSNTDLSVEERNEIQKDQKNSNNSIINYLFIITLLINAFLLSGLEFSIVNEDFFVLNNNANHIFNEIVHIINNNYDKFLIKNPMNIPIALTKLLLLIIIIFIIRKYRDNSIFFISDLNNNIANIIFNIKYLIHLDNLQRSFVFDQPINPNLTYCNNLDLQNIIIQYNKGLIYYPLVIDEITKQNKLGIPINILPPQTIDILNINRDSNKNNNANKIFVLWGKSGSGKSSLSNTILDNLPYGTERGTLSFIGTITDDNNRTINLDSKFYNPDILKYKIFGWLQTTSLPINTSLQKLWEIFHQYITKNITKTQHDYFIELCETKSPKVAEYIKKATYKNIEYEYLSLPNLLKFINLDKEISDLNGKFGHISGGQQKRFSIAMFVMPLFAQSLSPQLLKINGKKCIIQNTKKILLCDEVYVGLPLKSRQELYETIFETKMSLIMSELREGCKQYIKNIIFIFGNSPSLLHDDLMNTNEYIYMFDIEEYYSNIAFILWITHLPNEMKKYEDITKNVCDYKKQLPE